MVSRQRMIHVESRLIGHFVTNYHANLTLRLPHSPSYFVSMARERLSPINGRHLHQAIHTSKPQKLPGGHALKQVELGAGTLSHKDNVTLHQSFLLIKTLERKAHSFFTNRWFKRVIFSAGLCATFAGFTFFYMATERVPITKRLRLNIFARLESYEVLEKIILDKNPKMMDRYHNKILSASDDRVKFVRNVFDRLLQAAHEQHFIQKFARNLPQSKSQDVVHTQWEVYVIEDDMPEAFFKPFGKVFVFTGILSLCPDEDSLAQVLAHEMAHRLASHMEERTSHVSILGLSLYFFKPAAREMMFSLLLLFALLPKWRVMESEADYIGQRLMSTAGYDPSKASGYFRSIMQIEDSIPFPPKWLRQHPPLKTRIHDLQEWSQLVVEASTPNSYGKRSKHNLTEELTCDKLEQPLPVAINDVEPSDSGTNSSEQGSRFPEATITESPLSTSSSSQVAVPV